MLWRIRVDPGISFSSSASGSSEGNDWLCRHTCEAGRKMFPIVRAGSGVLAGMDGSGEPHITADGCVAFNGREDHDEDYEGFGWWPPNLAGEHTGSGDPAWAFDSVRRDVCPTTASSSLACLPPSPFWGAVCAWLQTGEQALFLTPPWSNSMQVRSARTRPRWLKATRTYRTSPAPSPAKSPCGDAAAPPKKRSARMLSRSAGYASLGKRRSVPTTAIVLPTAASWNQRRSRHTLGSRA